MDVKQYRAVAVDVETGLNGYWLIPMMRHGAEWPTLKIGRLQKFPKMPAAASFCLFPVSEPGACPAGPRPSP
jgi:hypothetical protein